MGVAKYKQKACQVNYGLINPVTWDRSVTSGGTKCRAVSMLTGLERLDELVVCQRLEEYAGEEFRTSILLELSVGRNRKDRKAGKARVGANLFN